MNPSDLPASADIKAQREAAWRRVWQSRQWPAWGWLPVSLLYGALSRIRQAGYATGWWRTQRVACPVLVVGNVIAGGAGKTPTTIALVEHLQRAGLHVGVISRGHGGKQAQCQAVNAQSNAADVGDEPLLIHLRTGAPVFVARQRALAAQHLLAAHPDTQLIVCDDGLQHLALHRDWQLCVFDERGIGNGWLLPAGPLREAWPKKSVDWVVQIVEKPVEAESTAGSDSAHPSRIHPIAHALLATRSLADHAVDGAGHHVALETLRSQAVIAFAGIAKPEVFFAALQQRGVTPERCIALGDHASAVDHPAVRQLLEDAADKHVLLCTEKDAVKLWPQHPHVLAVPLHLNLPARLLDDVLSAVRPS